MFKSIFWKYFSVTALVISCTFLLLSAAQAVLAGRYWVAEKEHLLTDNATTVAGFLSENAVEGPNNTYYLPQNLSPVLHRLATVADSSVLVSDAQHTILLCSHETDCPHHFAKLPSSLTTALTDEPYFVVGRLANIYDTNQYTAVVPMVKHNQVMGYVLVSSPADDLQIYVWDNLRISMLSGLAVMTVMFVVLYVITYRMVRPLRQMAVATRQFSRGDFSSRIHVSGKDEVAELATALNGMAVTLSSEEEMRRSFVANVSHELKTPMTSIAGFIDGILDGTIPPEKQEYYLRIVTDEVKRLSRLVHAMLNLSRIDSGKLQLHPVTFDITETVCTSLLTFEQAIDSKAITVEGLEDCPPAMVSGDYDLMQQVVYNLLENAVKFTNAGGTITVHIQPSGTHTTVSIRNTGAGIPATELPHIFERFYKSDRSRGLDKTGTGLGLYLVKSIINLHSGEITVSSVENEYCEFRFRLPSAR